MLKKHYRFRLDTLNVVPFLALFALAPKLFDLQVVKRSHFLERAESQHTGTKRLAPTRGRILDADGQELAGSIMVHVPYIDPRILANATSGSLARKKARKADDEDAPPKTQTADATTSACPSAPADPKLFAAFTRDLAEAAGCDAAELLKTLQGATRSTRLPVELDPERRTAVENVFRKWSNSVPREVGWFEDMSRRHYAEDGVAAHVVGFTMQNETGDNSGVDGIERQYDPVLRGNAVKFQGRINAARNMMEPAPEDLVASTYGQTVVLTIDSTIQRATEHALASAVLQHNADAAVGIVYRVKTGEILAMANVPTYEINQRAMAGNSEKRNRVLKDAIEPGSVMKMFTFSCLFDQGKGSPDQRIECGDGVLNLGTRIIRDVHGIGSAPIRKVFEQSSNVGTIKAAMNLNPSQFRRQLVAFGFGETTDLDLPYESPGLLYPYSRWTGLSMSSLPMGYELQVTAVQVAAAAGVLGNDGWYMQPHMVKEIRDWHGNTLKKIEPVPLRRVVRPETCRQMIDMMEQVVEKGTGKTAQIPGYRIGGKTGTTKKLDPETRKYTMSNYIASFCGLAPLSDPEVAIYVYIDNPKSGDFFGGKVAGPVFREIALATLKHLNIREDADPAKQKQLTVAEGSEKKSKSRKATSPPVTMESVKASLQDIVPRAIIANNKDRAVKPGIMPDLQGLTMKEAQQILAKSGMLYNFNGSGVVLEQVPGAYETLEPGQRASLTFGPERQWLACAIVSPSPFDPDETEDRLARVAAAEATTADDSQDSELVLERHGDSISIPVTNALSASASRKSKEVTIGKAGAAARTPLRSARQAPAETEAIPDGDDFANQPPAWSGGKTSWAKYEQTLKKTEAARGKSPATRSSRGSASASLSPR